MIPADKMNTVGSREYSLDEVLPYVDPKAGDRVYEGFRVRMDSQRYLLFATSATCVHCGIAGSVFLLEQNRRLGPTHPVDRAHFNLYAKTPDGLVLMTKDHIIPRSKGGRDVLENYQTMCYPCNQEKGSGG